MQKFFILLICCIASIICYSQKTSEPTSPAQSVFIEIGGNGLLFSANYDVRFGPRQNGLGGRLGVGFFGGSGGGILTVPAGINYLAGKAPNFLEVGLGYTYATFTGSDDFFAGSGNILVPSIGYRYQQKSKGLMARVVFSPLIGLDEGGGWGFFGGIGVGYKF